MVFALSLLLSVVLRLRWMAAALGSLRQTSHLWCSR